MDRFIAGFPADQDGDLMLSRPHGVAWQRDMSWLVTYDKNYFDKCAGYEGQEIARIYMAVLALSQEFENWLTRESVTFDES